MAALRGGHPGAVCSSRLPHGPAWRVEPGHDEVGTRPAGALASSIRRLSNIQILREGGALLDEAEARLATLGRGRSGEPLHLDGARARAHLGEVERELHAHQVVHIRAERLLDPERHIG